MTVEKDILCDDKVGSSMQRTSGVVKEALWMLIGEF